MLTNCTMDGLTYTGPTPSFLGPYQNIHRESTGKLSCKCWVNILHNYCVDACPGLVPSPHEAVCIASDEKLGVSGSDAMPEHTISAESTNHAIIVWGTPLAPLCTCC